MLQEFKFLGMIVFTRDREGRCYWASGNEQNFFKEEGKREIKPEEIVSREA